MTVIRPNSVSGINSITAQADEIKVFKSNGTQGGLIIGGANLNATTGISTLAALKVTGNLDVEGVLTYQDVTNVDSLGIGTFRTGINVSGGQLDVGSNIKLGNAGVITATSFSGDGSNLTGIDSTKIETGNTKVETIDTGSDGHIKFTTEGTARSRIDVNGHFTPEADNTYDLGTSSLRWRDIYTGDLNLSNEGKSNDVDGTWGNYTIQEGESDLFLINNRSGKKYKFNLTEVS